MGVGKPLKKKKKKSRVLIVDDHPIARYGIAQLINHEPDLSVCGEAEDAHTGLEAVGASKPDLVIVDLLLKGQDGFELIKNIKAQYEKLPILVLSMYGESPYAERAFRAGARGYIVKREATEQVVKAIRRLLSGDIYVSDQLAARLAKQMVERRLDAGESAVDSLSNRELQVFRFIGQGYRPSQIADALRISEKTVESYRARIKEKLQLKDATELLQHAIQWAQGEKLP